MSWGLLMCCCEFFLVKVCVCVCVCVCVALFLHILEYISLLDFYQFAKRFDL